MQTEKTEVQSKSLLAILLILTGVVWILHLLGVELNLWNFWKPFHFLFSHLGRIIFSWPMILVVAGVIMVTGKKQGGWILIVLGGIFLLPRIFMFPDFSLSIIAPLIIIFAGISLIMKRF